MTDIEKLLTDLVDCMKQSDERLKKLEENNKFIWDEFERKNEELKYYRIELLRNLSDLRGLISGEIHD